MYKLNYNERKTIYELAIELWGEHAQKLMAVEEMSELTKALCKDFRGKTDLANIVEEIADVTIMLEQLQILFNCNEEVCAVVDYKMERLAALLAEFEVH